MSNKTENNGQMIPVPPSSTVSMSSFNSLFSSSTSTTTAAVGAAVTASTAGGAGTASASITSQVRVGIRVRPLTSKEEGFGGNYVVLSDPMKRTIELSTSRFTYDFVFDSNMSQPTLYHSVSTPLLNSFVDGFNATIIAYGQTGSGKTFTMGSEAHADLDIGDSSGLIPRFMNDFFCALAEKKQKADETQNGFNYQLNASFLEVYGEDVHDLLDKSRQALPLRENETGGIVCAGLTAKSINNVSQALEVLHEGTMNRTTAATLMNLTSSRSHAVFTVTLTQHETRQNSGSKNQVEMTSTSRFTFVDLAGSERMKKTGAEGERAREGIRINEGLLALGNVINALADDDRLQEGKKIHVPYRQSKLTRLLQDALGGNSQTLFLACVSPSDTNASETLSTLRYANRARNIKNVASRNVDSAALEMQRLQSYVGVLQAELIKCRFARQSRNSGSSFTSLEDGLDDDNSLGRCDDDLAQRKDVVEYIEKLANIAQNSSGMESMRFSCNLVHAITMVPTAKMENTAFLLTSPRKIIPLHPRSTCTPMVERNDSPLHNKSILDDFDPGLLGETNPDEEMAILDQLLDIQHQDQLFDNQKEKDNAELKLVNGELAEQEILLLQLRKSLEVYHGMKIKYENLLTEVQQLETEKSQLAKKLQHATADPSQGCSSTIKREMEKVEQSLIRARNETRKHRELYRKAEIEAQKCKALERTIAELKTSRAQLIKKQRDTAARHREYTETKTREILSLKRKGKKTENELSKLQRNVEAHQRNMNKRQAYCNNLSAKLKQTETHLMKLLSMRQRDLRGGRTHDVRHDKRKAVKTALKENCPPVATDNEDHFAKDTPELESVKILIDKHVHQKINQKELKRQYKECYSRYSEALRRLVNTVRNTDDEIKPEDQVNGNHSTEVTIEELELKVDLAANELERIKMQLSSFEKSSSIEENDESVLILMSTLKKEKAPLLRSLLMDTISSYVDTEATSRYYESELKRKESMILSLESEIECMTSSVNALSSEIKVRNTKPDEDGIDSMEMSTLLAEKDALNNRLQETEQEIASLKQSTETLAKECKNLKFAASESIERCAFAEVSLQQQHGVSAPNDVLLDMQRIWREIGASPSTEDRFYDEISNCLQNTCARKLCEAVAYKGEVEKQIDDVTKKTNAIAQCLGIDVEAVVMDGDLIQRLQTVRQRQSELQPNLIKAVVRRDAIVRSLRALMSSMGTDEGSISLDHQKLLAEADINPSVDSNQIVDVSIQFMDRCDQEISELRLLKTQALSRNNLYLIESRTFANEMQLSSLDIQEYVENNISKRHGSLHLWWKNDVAKTVVDDILSSTSIIQINSVYSMHLAAIHESLQRIERNRRSFSDKLHSIIERSQQTLLRAVDGEMDASEAYSSFHEALFSLPALSKGRIHACISEISMLNEGVDAMTQSEIEALTVVWEALSISMSERGKFWADIDTSIHQVQINPISVFDDIAKVGENEGEEWLNHDISECGKVFQQLESRLLKLELIHIEVERLRTRQDAKSKVISLDSEICIINSKLCEFEEKKCDKSRLTTKKDTSSNLLKEERFRKQMQSKFSSKLEQLKNLLKIWKLTEGIPFSNDLLSEEVRALLSNSPRSDFMHLRTVKYKGASKRKVADPKQSESHCSPPQSCKRSVASSKKSVLSKGINSKKDQILYDKILPRPSPAMVTRKNMEKKRKMAEDVGMTDFPRKKLHSDTTSFDDRKPFSPVPVDNSSKNLSRWTTKSTHGAKQTQKTTLDPFAVVLEQSNSPLGNKEN